MIATENIRIINFVVDESNAFRRLVSFSSVLLISATASTNCPVLKGKFGLERVCRLMGLALELRLEVCIFKILTKRLSHKKKENEAALVFFLLKIF